MYRAVADHVIGSGKRDRKQAGAIEGSNEGRLSAWADYIDYVVHVFHSAVREF